MSRTSVVAPIVRMVRWRLWKHPLRSALTIVGISAGVTLMVVVQAVNATLQAPFDGYAKQLFGDATLQVDAQSPSGVDQKVVTDLRRVRGVEVVAPMIERSAVLYAGRESHDVPLLGIDQAFSELGGTFSQTMPNRPTERDLGLYVSERVSEHLNVGVGDRVRIAAGRDPVAVIVVAVVDDDQLGRFAGASFVAAPLGLAQRLAGAGQRIDSALIVTSGEPDTGLRQRIAATVGSQAVVNDLDVQSGMLSEASAISRAAASLLGANCLGVGALLAASAMLLSALERRREVAVIKAIGASRTVIVFGGVFDALFFGVLGAILGTAVGYATFTWTAPQPPAFLTAAFALLPPQRFPAWAPVVGGVSGLVASLGAATYPTLRLVAVDPAEAMRSDGIAQRSDRWPGRTMLVLGLVLSGVTALAAGSGVGRGIPAVALTMCAAAALTIGAVPALLRLAARAPFLGRLFRVAVGQLSARPTQAAAIAVVCTLSTGLLLIVEGVTRSIETATDDLSSALFADADLWVSRDTPQNVYLQEPFDRAWGDRLAAVPGVASADATTTRFLDWDGQLVLAIGAHRVDDTPLPAIRVFAGEHNPFVEEHQPPQALMTASLAKQRDLGLGDEFTVPTPAGRRTLELVTLLPSYGWPPGTVVVDQRTYDRWWPSTAATIVAIQLDPGASRESVKDDVATLVRGAGLRVETASEAQRRSSEVASDGTEVLRQIAAGVGLASVLAVAAVMLLTIAQSRRTHAILLAVGLSRLQLGMSVLIEVASVAVLGVVLGCVAGIAGSALAVRALVESTSYPLHFSVHADLIGKVGLLTVLMVVVSSLAPLNQLRRMSVAEALSND
ncbi:MULTISPECIES: FtsX-like permease family protein [unclassified Nocardioides]|uniref:FtsX-like permease family protein n=1 Tax=unclassified Nocardioides TaxID=2615069 RepID=UPI0007026C09|nr:MULTISPECIES: FtsX-like permease family protein [unclassified Nocardioides]KRC54070.1 hypothetical protein ASE19_08380 [Nocardioides sp. Root79]KRC71406.1 hypothetical protein ASE20_10795 [Nocardioides sp. Root240]